MNKTWNKLDKCARTSTNTMLVHDKVTTKKLGENDLQYK